MFKIQDDVGVVDVFGMKLCYGFIMVQQNVVYCMGGCVDIVQVWCMIVKEVVKECNILWFVNCGDIGDMIIDLVGDDVGEIVELLCYIMVGLVI